MRREPPFTGIIRTGNGERPRNMKYVWTAVFWVLTEVWRQYLVISKYGADLKRQLL